MIDLKNLQFQTNNHVLGPKPFPLDRLMAVFYAIVEGKVAPTANIFMQVNEKREALDNSVRCN